MTKAVCLNDCVINYAPDGTWEMVSCDPPSEIITCPFTRTLVRRKDAVRVGPMMPSVAGYWLASPDYKEAHRMAYKDYTDSEANCNTCKHLERVKHEKNPQGMLFGLCKHTGEHIMFHPHDPMHMPCYKAREAPCNSPSWWRIIMGWFR